MRFATNKIEQRTIGFLILFLLSFIPLFAQDEQPETKRFLNIKYDQTFLSISPVLSPRICFGLVNTDKQDDGRYLESIYYLHAFETFSILKAYGFAFRGNTFIAKNKRSGLYLIGNVGIDYVQFEPFSFDPGGSNTSDNGIKSTLFPNLAFGVGGSIKMKNDSYLRLEMDFGLKWFLSNFYLSFIW